MAYAQQYTGDRILTWENFTSTATPLSAGNLNKIQNTLSGIDTQAFNEFNRLENAKADQSTVNGTFNRIDFSTATGEFVFYRVDGSTVTVDTALERVLANFTYDPPAQALVLTYEDGTTQSVSLSAFVTQYEFTDTDTIAWTIGGDGTVRANVKAGSITADKMDPDYLTDVTAQAANASSSADTAAYQALLAQSYAKGGTNMSDRPGEDTDNAKYYKEKAERAAKDAEQAAGLTPFEGATQSTAGEAGLVPAPAAGEQDKFLKGDGAWADVDALPSGGTEGQILTKKSGTDGDAEWAEPPDTGVTSFNSRTGAVSPQSGDYTADMVARGSSDVDADLTAVENGVSTANGNISTINGNISTINSKLGSTNISGIGSTITGAISNLGTLYNTRHDRTRERFTDLAKLASAAAGQNLEKYGLAIGDYYIGASGYEYTIADMDTFYGGYDSYAVLSTHHVCLVVDTKQNCQWNTSDTTASGYNGSNLHSYLKGTVLNNVRSDLGTSHLLPHQKLLTTSNTAWAWQTGQYIAALSEVQVYGSTIWSLNGFQEGEAARQLEVFRKYRWNQVFGNKWVWLRNIQSSSGACNANGCGHANGLGASYSGRAAGLIIFH